MRVFIIAALIAAAGCSEERSGVAGDDPLADAEAARNDGRRPQPPRPEPAPSDSPPPGEPVIIPTEPQIPAPDDQ